MSKQTIKELQNLANINQDACAFYKEAQNEVESEQLRRTFADLETLHKSIVNNIQEHIASRGADIDTKETFAGKAQKFWGELVAKASHRVDEKFIAHLEEAEDRCLHSMEDAVKMEDIEEETTLVLQRELQALRKSHDYMKALKDVVCNN